MSVAALYYQTLKTVTQNNPVTDHPRHFLSTEGLCVQGGQEGGGKDGDFMSEAKDWAGELISGQTGTGRILVSDEELSTVFITLYHISLSSISFVRPSLNSTSENLPRVQLNYGLDHRTFTC